MLVDVNGWKDDGGNNQLVVLFPLPYCVGEAPWPGNADEKIRCEAGTYA